MLFFSFALAIYALFVLIDPFQPTSRNLAFSLVMFPVGLAFLIENSKGLAKGKALKR